MCFVVVSANIVSLVLLYIALIFSRTSLAHTMTIFPPATTTLMPTNTDSFTEQVGIMKN